MLGTLGRVIILRGSQRRYERVSRHGQVHVVQRSIRWVNACSICFLKERLSVTHIIVCWMVGEMVGIIGPLLIVVIVVERVMSFLHLHHLRFAISVVCVTD